MISMQLLVCMSDEHLISSLDSCDLTQCEQELLNRLNNALDTRKSRDEIYPRVHEAIAQYPNEDFLTNILLDMQQLSNNLRGDNKKKCSQIIEQLQNLEQNINSSSEYGISELQRLL